jgi:hypothetical protein
MIFENQGERKKTHLIGDMGDEIYQTDSKSIAIHYLVVIRLFPNGLKGRYNIPNLGPNM